MCIAEECDEDKLCESVVKIQWELMSTSMTSAMIIFWLTTIFRNFLLAKVYFIDLLFIRDLLLERLWLKKKSSNPRHKQSCNIIKNTAKTSSAHRCFSWTILSMVIYSRNSEYYGSMKWKYQLHIVHWIIVNYYGIYFIQFFGVFQAIIGKYLEWISNFYTVVAIQGICRSVL